MLQNFTRRATAFKAIAAGALLSAFTAAHAALPASVGTAFAAVETEAGELRDLVVPIVVAILGMVLLIKLIKRFGNKI